MSTLDKYTDGSSLFDGRYRLLRLLSAEGGTADVWLAENYASAETVFSPETDEFVAQEGTGVLVAIKIYRPHNALDMEGEQTFRQEFRMIFSRHHANLVPVTEYNVCDGLPYLVMPYCERGSTEALIGCLTDKGEIWHFLLDVASGLEYLHSCHPAIIHQDIKPGNIIIDLNGRYCITDFGFSTTLGSEAVTYLESPSYGTQAYMPPERFDDGADETLWTPRAKSDIWSLGATAYHLVTGQLPFGQGGGAAQAADTPLPPLPHGVPHGARRIIHACLSYAPQRRPTAAEIAEAVRQHGQRHRLRVASLAIAAAIAAAVFMWLVLTPQPEASGKEPQAPQSAFARLSASGDSIVSAEQRETRSAAYVNAAAATRRLSEAAAVYRHALATPLPAGSTAHGGEAARRDSVKRRLRDITLLLPRLSEYSGICDTMELAHSESLPLQEAKYARRRARVSQRLKHSISRL